MNKINSILFETKKPYVCLLIKTIFIFAKYFVIRGLTVAEEGKLDSGMREYRMFSNTISM